MCCKKKKKHPSIELLQSFGEMQAPSWPNEVQALLLNLPETFFLYPSCYSTQSTEL